MSHGGGAQIRVLNLQFGALASSAAEDDSASALLMDEPAFRKFYLETSRPLLRYLAVVTRNPDLAQDLLQEAYCRLLNAELPAMDVGQTRGYLFRIASNLARDHWREPGETSLPNNYDQMGSDRTRWERNLHLRQAFDRLKPREKQLLWLAYVEGSNHQEIADCTGLRARSIRMLLFRARRRLLQLIGAPSSNARKVEK